MPTGAPDWTKRIDVTLQRLSELIVRPRYGDFRRVSGTMYDLAAGTHLLVNVSARGQTYGGYVLGHGQPLAEGGCVILTVDGVSITTIKFYELLLWGITRPYDYAIYLMGYDYLERYFTAGISSQISFESNLKIEYMVGEGYGNVSWNVIYAVI